MFPTPRQTSRSREQTLNNLHSFSSACLDSSQRFSDLLAESGRSSLKNLEAFSLPEANLPSEAGINFWRENTLSPKFIDEFFEIIADTHKAMIEAAEAQIQMFDEIVFASIDQATHYSPWEAEIGFKAMRDTLQSAEQTLHNMSTASIQTLSLTEQEMHKVAEILAEKPKPRKKATSAKSPAALAG